MVLLFLLYFWTPIRLKKKKIITLFWIRKKFGFLYVVKVFAIAVRLLTKIIKRGNWKRMVMFHFTLLNFRFKDSTYLIVWQHAFLVVGGVVCCCWGFFFVFLFQFSVFWDMHLLIPCLLVFEIFFSPFSPSGGTLVVIFKYFTCHRTGACHIENIL